METSVYKTAAESIMRAGQIPFPVNDTLLGLLATIMTEDQARFIPIFTKPLNHDELRSRSDLTDEALQTMLDSLMDEGIITGLPSRSDGTMVYRLLPLIPGMFEYTLMRGETGPKQKKLARLFHQLFNELAHMVQENYDTILPAFKAMPPMTRVIPVERQVDPKYETVMPYEDVKKVVDRFHTFAVAHCYCRHQKDLLDQPCQVTTQRKNCLFFGRTARFVIDRKFGEEITKDQAKQILADAEKDGLVHKAFHEASNPDKDEMAICNCCKCCCETFQLFYRGGAPTATHAAYLAKVDDEACSACEVCADMCPMEAIEIQETARVDEGRCIGCGVCAYHCPTEAITLKRTGQRLVFVPPPKVN